MAATWIAREDLRDVIRPSRAHGLLQLPASADVACGMTNDELAGAVRISARELAAVGVGAEDRVVIALNDDGVAVGSLLALATAELADAVASCGPRGRMRLLRALEAVRATTLVITPTGAMDLLARLHLEFQVDPLDLELERLLLVGEIPTPKSPAQLASEFGARVDTVLCDPFFGVAVAHSRGDRLVPGDGLLRAAAIADDVEVDPVPGGVYELVLHPTWSAALRDCTLRTGLVVEADDAGDGLPLPSGTVGDRILVRGQWLSLRAVAGALRLIDGIEAWAIEVRRDGTLDQVTLAVAFARPSLAANPMWSARVRDALHGLTPVEITVEVRDDAAAVGDRVVDHRGQHRGLDRGALD
jgi:hypothetical protein